MNMKDEGASPGVVSEEGVTPPAQNLTGKDVVNGGVGVGKEVLKQTAVWVIAGAMTGVIRQVIDKFRGKG